ncbi:MAG: hypothetical protein H8E61_06550 [Bacteroidetes bacterium]|nr:hypothetical protein [Bacteroidota bacterium]
MTQIEQFFTEFIALALRYMDQETVYETKLVNKKARKGAATARRIREWFELYKRKYLANPYSEKKDQVYEHGFIKFLSDKACESKTTVKEFLYIAREETPEFLDAICEGIPLGGKIYSVSSAYKKLRSELFPHPCFKKEHKSLLSQITETPEKLFNGTAA